MSATIRPATAEDKAAVMALAHRLEEGVAPWRDRAAVASAVSSWVESSIGRLGDDRSAVFVAESHADVIGFVTVGEQTHWSGDVDASIGELVVATSHAGRGIGRTLVAEAMDWARQQGFERVSLATGAANRNARDFYRALGFDEEDVTLSRAL